MACSGKAARVPVACYLAHSRFRVLSRHALMVPVLLDMCRFSDAGHDDANLAQGNAGEGNKAAAPLALPEPKPKPTFQPRVFSGYIIPERSDRGHSRRGRPIGTGETQTRRLAPLSAGALFIAPQTATRCSVPAGCVA